MTPARGKSARTYKPPRDRRELILAALAVVGVLAFTIVMVLVLAPEDDTAVPPPFSVPTSLPVDPTATTLPIDPTAPTLPGATAVVPPTTAPVG